MLTGRSGVEQAGLNTVKLNHAIICPKPRTSMAEPNTNLQSLLSAASMQQVPSLFVTAHYCTIKPLSLQP